MGLRIVLSEFAPGSGAVNGPAREARLLIDQYPQVLCPIKDRPFRGEVCVGPGRYGAGAKRLIITLHGPAHRGRIQDTPTFSNEIVGLS
jgi:hypothetical protein